MESTSPPRAFLDPSELDQFPHDSAQTDLRRHDGPSNTHDDTAAGLRRGHSDGEVFRPRPHTHDRGASETVNNYTDFTSDAWNDNLGRDHRSALNARRSSLVAMDRKRRLTISAEQEAHRRRTQSGGMSSLPSANRAVSGMRPPPPPRKDSDERPTAGPGASSASAIDVSTPSPSGRHSSRDIVRRRSSGVREYSVPPWQPDSDVSKCPICNTHFSFFYRKHHCRKCGRVVCASCSPHRITIPRQFIVHPPTNDIQTHNHSQAGVSTEVIDLTEEDSPQERAPLASIQSTSRFEPINPGLGGGEEVRLCNPCVPDPQIEPTPRFPSYTPPSPSSRRRTMPSQGSSPFALNDEQPPRFDTSEFDNLFGSLEDMDDGSDNFRRFAPYHNRVMVCAKHSFSF